jgi:hypothetical protein
MEPPKKITDICVIGGVVSMSGVEEGKKVIPVLRLLHKQSCSVQSSRRFTMNTYLVGTCGKKR